MWQLFVTRSLKQPLVACPWEAYWIRFTINVVLGVVRRASAGGAMATQTNRDHSVDAVYVPCEAPKAYGYTLCRLVRTAIPAGKHEFGARVLVK